MSKVSKVWIFSDSSERLAELVSGGLNLGKEVAVFVIGSQEDVASAYSLGVNKVYYLGESESSRVVESYVNTMAQVISSDQSKGLVLVPGTKRCRNLASLLGVKLSAGVVTEVQEIAVVDDVCQAKRMVYGGLANSTEAINTNVGIIVLAGGVFEAVEADPSKTGEPTVVDFVEPDNEIKCVERRPKQSSSVDLKKAKRVVAIGRGFTKQEDIKLAEELASAVEAELACSRPIAETEKWMGHERYIGISSVMVKPDIYVAIGISGQIQHMVGAKDSQTVIAINKDKNAPIFAYADYGIVGDLYTVLPIVTKALAK